MKFIQFPWRFQPFVALACGLLAAAALEERKRLNRHLRKLLAAVLFCLMIANCTLTILLTRRSKPDVTRDQVREVLSPQDLPPVPIQEARRLLNERYMKGLPYAANQVSYRPLGSDSNLYPPSEEPGGLSFVTGRGRLISQKLTISYREFRVDNDEPVRVRIGTYYYPHWVATLMERRWESTSSAAMTLSWD